MLLQKRSHYLLDACNVWRSGRLSAALVSSSIFTVNLRKVLKCTRFIHCPNIVVVLENISSWIVSANWSHHSSPIDNMMSMCNSNIDMHLFKSIRIKQDRWFYDVHKFWNSSHSIARKLWHFSGKNIKISTLWNHFCFKCMAVVYSYTHLYIEMLIAFHLV